MFKFLNPKFIYFFIKAIFQEGINLMTVLNFASKFYGVQSGFYSHQKHINYVDLYDEVKNLRNYLSVEYRLCISSKVAIISKNNIEMVKYIFATSSLGCKLYLLNADLSFEQIELYCKKLKIEVLIFDETIENQFSNLSTVKLISLSKNIVLSPKNLKTSKVYKSKIVLLSGGTSGNFKSIERKTSILQFIFPFYTLIKHLKLTNYQSVFIATPIYHGFGFASLIISIILGSKIFLAPKFIASDIVKNIQNNKIEVITLVPIMLRRLLEQKTNLSSLKCIISGGAKLDVDLITSTHDQIGEVIYNLYGTTEAGFCVLATPKLLKQHANCIGKPILGVNIKLMNQQNGIGELYIKSAWTMANKSTNWIHTGDLAYQNNKGVLFLLGRSDDMIVSGGENVYFIDLENVLLQHDSISEVAVIGVNDQNYGKRLKVYVVMKKNYSFNKEEIFNWLKPKVARFQMPVEIVCVPQFTYTSVGKISKKHLG
jgi:fatty-acyl-CoA synthase